MADWDDWDQNYWDQCQGYLLEDYLVQCYSYPEQDWGGSTGDAFMIQDFDTFEPDALC